MKKFHIETLTEKCFGLGHYPCANVNSHKGEIYLPYGTANEEKDTGYALYSSDNGRNFEKAEAIPYRTALFQQMSDGTFMALENHGGTFRNLFNCSYGDAQFILNVYRAETYEDVMEGRVTTEFAVLDIPELTWGYGDSNNKGIGCVTGWKELSNGDVLLTMYGQTKSDTTLCPYFVKWGPYDFYLYRTWCLVSHDKGKTFEFVTTIADVQTYPIPDINAEGYCETDIVELENGHILAVLRTGGHNVKSPLYACHSYDYGKTWEKPYEIYEWGVLPKILKMKSGRVVVATGHPDVFVLVSDDGGITWSDKVTVQDDPGDWNKTTSGYNSIFECEDGVITLIYDASFEAKNDVPEDAQLQRYVYQKTFRLIED